MTMANNIKVSDPSDLNTAMQNIFMQLGVSVDDAFKQACTEVGKEAVKMLKANSPTGRGSKKGHYKNGWKYVFKKTKNGVIESTIYNATKPGLAHLIEKPHKKVDRTGRSHGNSVPQVHIKPVDDWVQQELPRRISQKIQQK